MGEWVSGWLENACRVSGGCWPKPGLYCRVSGVCVGVCEGARDAHGRALAGNLLNLADPIWGVTSHLSAVDSRFAINWGAFHALVGRVLYNLQHAT